MSTFTLTGTFVHQDAGSTPIVGSQISIKADPFPLFGLINGAGKIVTTDANGQISVSLTTGVVGLYYVARSLAKEPIFKPVRFLAPASGTLDLNSLIFYNPDVAPVEQEILAARDATIAAAAAVSAGTWQATAFDARSRQAYAPAPSGDVTGATDTAALASVLGGMGAASGLTRPAADPLVVELGAGPYYINANTLTVKPGQALRSKSPSGTLIYCVGGSSGQAFITTTDPSFSLTGTAPTSRGGQTAGIVLDGTKAGRGTVGLRRGDIINGRLDVSVQHFGGKVYPTATSGSVTLTIGGRPDSGCATTANRVTITDPAAVLADVGKTITGSGIPANTVVTGVIAGVSVETGYAAPAVANATGSGSISLQVGWVRTDTVTLTSGSNVIPDTNAVAADLGMPVFGTNIPLGAIVMAVAPGTSLTIGLPAIGVQYRNTNGWCERNQDFIETFNCAEHVVLDGSGGSFKSFDYNTFTVTQDLEHGQHGIVFRGGSFQTGTNWRVVGTNTMRGTANSGVQFMQSENSDFNGGFDMKVENSVVASMQGAVSHFIQDSSSTFIGHGAMLFYVPTGAVQWQSSRLQTGFLTAGQPSLGFTGQVGGCWGLIAAIGYGQGGGRTIGVTARNPGSNTVAGSAITLNWETGNLFKPPVLTAGTAYSVAFDNAMTLGPNAALDLVLILRQPSSGSPATITSWFSGITWQGGVVPQLDPTPSSATIIRLVTTDGGATWHGTTDWPVVPSRAMIAAPANAVAVAIDRTAQPGVSNLGVLTSGSTLVSAMPVEKPCVASAVNFYTGNTAGSGTAGNVHQWAALLDSTGKVVAVTADQTLTAMASFTKFTWTFSAAATLAPGLYFVELGIAMNTTMPNVGGVATNTANSLAAPVIAGVGATGATTPPSLAATRTLPSALNSNYPVAAAWLT